MLEKDGIAAWSKQQMLDALYCNFATFFGAGYNASYCNTLTAMGLLWSVWYRGRVFYGRAGTVVLVLRQGLLLPGAKRRPMPLPGQNCYGATLAVRDSRD